MQSVGSYAIFDYGTCRTKNLHRWRFLGTSRGQQHHEAMVIRQGRATCSLRLHCSSASFLPCRAQRPEGRGGSGRGVKRRSGRRLHFQTHSRLLHSLPPRCAPLPLQTLIARLRRTFLPATIRARHVASFPRPPVPLPFPMRLCRACFRLAWCGSA